MIYKPWLTLDSENVGMCNCNANLTRAIDHLAHDNRALASASLGPGDQRSDMLPLDIGQVAGVAKLVTALAMPVLGGPHRGPCEPTKIQQNTGGATTSMILLMRRAK